MSDENLWRDGMVLWVVYSNPSDYPGKFVVRRQVAGPASPLVPDPEPAVVADTLDDARAVIPEWLIRLERDPKDDPVIVEVWL